MNILTLLAALTSLVCLVNATISQIRIEQLHRREMQQRIEAKDYPVYFFRTYVDHFDRRNQKLFDIKYYVEPKFYKKGGPIFLYNAGEGALQTWAMTGHIAELANQTQGLIVAIEHRYYGVSVPVPDLSGPNMKYLMTNQALADMAAFITQWEVPSDLNIELPPKSDRRWIMVGGSYPGNLSAWMRLKYPQLIYASYSSSAPVRAKLNFYEYDMAVGDDMDPRCAEALATMVRYIDTVLDRNNTEEMLALRTRFGLERVTSRYDFASALTDAHAYSVQYGRRNWIDKFCKVPSFDPYDPDSMNKMLDFFGNFQKDWMQSNNQSIEYYISGPGSTKLEDNMDGARQWLWQICREYGYWQIAPPPWMRPVRSKYVNVQYYEGICKLVFGDSAPDHASFEDINKEYGADRISASQIVYVNGEKDPWRRMSVSAPDAYPRNSTEDQPVYVIKGGHHCDDFDWTRTTDSESELEARRGIAASLKRWLAK